MKLTRVAADLNFVGQIDLREVVNADDNLIKDKEGKIDFREVVNVNNDLIKDKEGQIDLDLEDICIDLCWFCSCLIEDDSKVDGDDYLGFDGD